MRLFCKWEFYDHALNELKEEFRRNNRVIPQIIGVFEEKEKINFQAMSLEDKIRYCSTDELADLAVHEDEIENFCYLAEDRGVDIECLIVAENIRTRYTLNYMLRIYCIDMKNRTKPDKIRYFELKDEKKSTDAKEMDSSEPDLFIEVNPRYVR